MRRASIALVLVILVVPCGAQDATVDHHAVLGDEAYGVALQSFQYDATAPLAPHVVETVEAEGYVREKVVFNGSFQTRVPGYLAIPTSGSPPYPCVLQIHGLTDSKEDWWTEEPWHGASLTMGLLSEGYAVLALDAVHHGERAATLDYASPRSLIGKPGFVPMVIESTKDYRRAIDYLSGRSEIDTSRIGVIGVSMGTIISLPLAAVDDRVRVIVLVVPVPFPYRYALAPQNYARAVKDRPLLMLSATQDRWYRPEQAQALFDLIDSKTKKLVWYESGHTTLPAEFVQESIGWITKHLR